MTLYTKYNCSCGNIFELVFIEKGDTVLIQVESGQLYEVVVDNPYDYGPYPEACPECDFCPPDEFIERILNDE